MELLSCISWFLSNAWKFFTQVEVPGMGGITFAALFVGLFLAVLSLRLLSYMFGFGISDNGFFADLAEKRREKNAESSWDRYIHRND